MMFGSSFWSHLSYLIFCDYVEFIIILTASLGEIRIISPKKLTYSSQTLLVVKIKNKMLIYDRTQSQEVKVHFCKKISFFSKKTNYLQMGVETKDSAHQAWKQAAPILDV